MAAHEVIDGHRRVAEVAGELGVDTSLLHTWVRDERWRMTRTRETDTSHPDRYGTQPLSMPERAELVRLRATLAEQANEIAYLEEVLAHFAAVAAKASRLEPTAAECACRDLTQTTELRGESTFKSPKRTRVAPDQMTNPIQRVCHVI